MNNVFFSSDFHFSHYNLMKALNRPFGSIEEMNDKIISNFFSFVSKGDMVYFLGDLSWDVRVAEDFFKRLWEKSINFYFIHGNHDKDIRNELLNKYCRWNGWIKDISIDNQKISLCHYMMLSWNCSHHGAWHLHGHHHDAEQSKKAVGKVLNVCTDLHGFRPVSFEDVREYMKNRPDNWDLIKK